MNDVCMKYGMKYIDLFGFKKVRDAASGAASRTYG